MAGCTRGSICGSRSTRPRASRTSSPASWRGRSSTARALEFSRGLAAGVEPALWQHDLRGDLQAWIDTCE
ncbi:MAG: YaeQ family protein [Nannocystaceae bacterium]|nr:YaeQ family protein [Deltaproteobacteria bacterium]MBP7287613.1 YaeQ family protein [Nannocystaceae bacterium]